MRLPGFLQSARRTVGEYPRPFWTLVIGTFIDRLGGHMLFPFFALYITDRFGVGMTVVGALFAVWSVVAVVGSTVGGALADRWGRRSVLIFGLVASGSTSLLLAVVDSITLFFVVAVVVGTVAEAGWPAQEAMVADLLPEEKRAEGYGIIRVVFNLSVVIAPALGGLVAARSYQWLFIADAFTSAVMAFLVYFFIPETRPAATAGGAPETWRATFRGYGVPLRDRMFQITLLGAALMAIIYMQLNSSLGVFLRDFRQVTTQGYGALLSLNAAMVVAFQFWITRRIRDRPQFLMLALGAILTGLGFGLYGFIASYGWFLVAMAILTVGEMVWVPVGQALVARLASEAMRGRYMAAFGYSWTVAGIVGPLMAGAFFDSGRAEWLWYVSLGLGAASALTFLYGGVLDRQRVSSLAAETAGGPGKA